MNSKEKTITDPQLGQLQQAFLDFQERSEKLSDAYASMQKDFRKINLELDKKNKELAESLANQEEMQVYLNSILESMNNGVISIDNNKHITQFNKAASEIIGYSAGAVIGKKYSAVFGDNNLSERNVVDVLGSGKNFRRDEKVIWHKQGNPVPVSFQSSILRDQDNKQLGAVEIFTDISRIKELEEEMQQNKTMAALGEMAATVAHEIRNPLGAMGMWAGLLDRDFDKDDTRRETLGKIIDALSRLNRIVSNLLVYSRPIRAQLRKINLKDVLIETINFIDIEAERTGKKVDIIRTWKDDSPLHVLADPEKLQQIILNLCLNAVQAMPSGGRLSVACKKFKKNKKGFVSFSIEDDGIGIENDRINKIFDPFHTTKENGTGLGLAIVKKFVDHHSGYLKVTSKKNEGTNIQVFLPHLNQAG